MIYVLVVVGIIIIIHAYGYTELYFCLLLFIGGKVLVVLQSSSETQWSDRLQWLSFIQRKYQTNVGGEFFMFNIILATESQIYGFYIIQCLEYYMIKIYTEFSRLAQYRQIRGIIYLWIIIG